MSFYSLTMSKLWFLESYWNGRVGDGMCVVVIGVGGEGVEPNLLVLKDYYCLCNQG